MFNLFGHKKEARRDKWIFGMMLVMGTIGLIVAFILTLEKFHLLQDPNAILSCSINVVLNCSTVMQTWQSSVFGFPNMLIGLMGYPIVITVAVAGLSGVTFPRPFLAAANIFYGLGALFAYWLFFQSVYVIEILCPWCLVITFVTTIIFATITHYNLGRNTFGLGKRADKAVKEYLAKDIGKLLTAGWIVLLIALVFVKFGDSLFA